MHNAAVAVATTAKLTSNYNNVVSKCPYAKQHHKLVGSLRLVVTSRN